MKIQIKKIYDNLPTELDSSITTLIDSYNKGKYPLDCEISQVLGDINASESYRMISSSLAKELRQCYVYDFTEGKYGEVF